MDKFLKQPLYWAWAFVAIWSMHVLVTLFMQRWEGLTISLSGLLAAVLILAAIMSRRRKNFYPKRQTPELLSENPQHR